MKKKKILVIIIILFIVNTLVAVSTTIAYLVASPSKNNVLVKPDPMVTITETLSQEKIVSVRNDSNFTAYVRVALVVDYRSISNSQMIIPAENDVNYIFDTNWDVLWDLNGNYYYYNIPLPPGASTSTLLRDVELKPGKSVPAGYQLEVVVLADLIQADPVNGVTESWGVTP